MIKIYYRNLKTDALKELETFRVGSWLHVVDPTEDEIKHLVDKFSLEEGHLRDALDSDEMPRLEIEGDISYVFTRYSYMDKGQIYTTPILVAVGPNFLLTLAERPVVALEPFFAGTKGLHTTQKTKAFLQIIKQLLGTYNSFTKVINRQIRSTKAKFNVENVSNQDFIRFVGIEDILNDYLSELVPTNVILHGLMQQRDNLTFYEDDRDLIEDLLLQNRQLIEESKSNLRTIVNIRDAYSNIMTNNLNRQVKLLTSLTVVLTIPTIIGSIFGMNVHLPMQDSPVAFAVIMVTTLVLSGGLLLVFYRNRWF